MIDEEEKQFLKTLSRGKRLFERTVTRMDSDTIPGVEGGETYLRCVPTCVIGLFPSPCLPNLRRRGVAAVRYVRVPSRPDPADGGGEEVEGGHARLREGEAQSSGQFMTSQTVVNECLISPLLG